jgi:hypothetical protein
MQHWQTFMRERRGINTNLQATVSVVGSLLRRVNIAVSLVAGGVRLDALQVNMDKVHHEPTTPAMTEACKQQQNARYHQDLHTWFGPPTT